MGDQNVYPGPVDNSGLLRGKRDYASPVHTLNHLYECVAFTSLRGPQGSGLSHSGSNNKEIRGKGNENNIVDKVYRAGSFLVRGCHGKLSSIAFSLSVLCYMRQSEQGHRCKWAVSVLWLDNVLLSSSLPVDGDVLAIKEHLIDELDYILVPTEGWNKLVSWYGLTDGQEPIARKVRIQWLAWGYVWIIGTERALLSAVVIQVMGQ